MKGTSLTNANLAMAVFIQSRFDGADLIGVEDQDAVFEGSTFEGANR